MGVFAGSASLRSNTPFQVGPSGATLDKAKLQRMRPPSPNLPQTTIPTEAIEEKHQRVVDRVLNIRFPGSRDADWMGMKRAYDLLT